MELVAKAFEARRKLGLVRAHEGCTSRKRI